MPENEVRFCSCGHLIRVKPLFMGSDVAHLIEKHKAAWTKNGKLEVLKSEWRSSVIP